MIFSDGRKRSLDGVIGVFDNFAAFSGLAISLEKSTIYLAGVSHRTRQNLLQAFPFAWGSLPVRYLGLPLLTKRMRPADYTPLVDQVRSRLSTWTARFLSFAGRLQLLTSVIASLTNFWMAAFRLPAKCINELDSICSAFLWTGPDLNPRKAKIRWPEVCTPKKEGGLGLKKLKDVNKVSVLRLVWRIITANNSLWVNWVKVYLIRQDSFWAMEIDSQAYRGSWMWRRILKSRRIADEFVRVQLGNGHTTSFWFDKWSPLGRLFTLTGQRGFIDLGIPASSTVHQVISRPQRRHRHRVHILTQIEEAIESARTRLTSRDDRQLWRIRENVFRENFTTSKTWEQIRQAKEVVTWYKGIWFTHNTPKYAFISWLALQNRLTTGDRMAQWGQNVSTCCILCQNNQETRSHLFFSCPYSSEVWTKLMTGLLAHEFSVLWDDMVALLAHNTLDQLDGYIFRYCFQTTLYLIWRERNARRHGQADKRATTLVNETDKIIRNRFSSIRLLGDTRYEDGLQRWFAHTSHPSE